MDLGIIGFPRSGKTAAFAALTGGHAESASFGRTGIQQHVGVVKVPDPRLDTLARLFHSRKIVPAEVRYLDTAGGPAAFEAGRGLGGPILNALGTVDALIHVARGFSDPSVAHVHGTVDPARDIEAVDLELAYSDAAVIERRLERLVTSLKAATVAQREAAAREQDWLEELKAQLEAGTPVREMDLNEEQHRALSSYALLTAKPLLVLLNIGEDQLAQQESLERELGGRFQGPGRDLLALCAKLEAELAQMAPAEAAEFRTALGAGEPGVDRVIRASYALLGYVSFLTTGPDESRAWAIRDGEFAVHAAGKIHSDLERGFIRAEVVPYDQLAACGSWAEAKRRGVLRSEGKTYRVQDGDVINVLFSRG